MIKLSIGPLDLVSISCPSSRLQSPRSRGRPRCLNNRASAWVETCLPPWVDGECEQWGSNGVLTCRLLLIYADGACGALSGAHTSPRLCGMGGVACVARQSPHGSVMTLRPASCIMYLWRAAHDGGGGGTRPPPHPPVSRVSCLSPVCRLGYTIGGIRPWRAGAGI